jgi:hypothetical protein
MHLIQQPRRFRPCYTLTFAPVTHTPSKVADNNGMMPARHAQDIRARP